MIPNDPGSADNAMRLMGSVDNSGNFPGSDCAVQPHVPAPPIPPRAIDNVKSQKVPLAKPGK